MDKAERAEYVMRLLEEDVKDRFNLSDDETEIRYNSRKTAARLLVKDEGDIWENVCTVSTDYGLSFAVWLRTEYHDTVKNLLRKILDKRGISYSKGTRGCRNIIHTHFDVIAW